MYLLFAGITYYPSGGFEDYIQHCHRIEDAKEFVEASKGGYEWAQIVDSKSRRIVLFGDLTAARFREYKGYDWFAPEAPECSTK